MLLVHKLLQEQFREIKVEYERAKELDAKKQAELLFEELKLVAYLIRASRKYHQKKNK